MMSFAPLFYSRNGFNNRLSFVNITDEDILAVEKCVRDEGLLYIEKKMRMKIDNTADILMYEDQLIEYFGETYASDPASFRFEIGDKKLIILLRDHIIQKQSEKGEKYLRRFRKPSRKHTKKKSSNTNDLQFEFADENYPPDHKNYRSIDENHEQLKSRLFNGVKLIMQSFVIAESISETFNLNDVSVGITNGKISGEINCVVCVNDTEKKRKIKPKKVFYESGGCSQFWVLANFKKHLKDVHKLHPVLQPLPNHDELPKMKKKSITRRQETVTSESNSIKSENLSFEYVDVPVILPNNSFDSSFESNRENVMYRQISDQIRKILGMTLLNNDEIEDISISLHHENSHSLTVAKCDKDGRCLFRSLIHQLNGRKLNTSEQTYETQNLRESVIKYITEHFPSFCQALQNRVYEELDDGDVIDDMDTECRRILNECLPNDTYWGGVETLKAVSEIYNVNILMFDELGKCRYFNEFIEVNNRTLILAYRIDPHRSEKDPLRNHYDSVCDIPSNLILDSIKYMSMFSRTHDTTL